MFDLAVIGLGAWGRRLVTSVQGKSDSVRFVATSVRTPSKIAPFCDEHGLRVGDALKDVDCVVVAGHAASHATDALDAVNAGNPVLVIKPLATTVEDSESPYNAAAKKGVLAAMGYDRCFAPAMDALRRRVHNGDLGRVFHASGDFSVDRMLIFNADAWKADPIINPPGSLADHMMYMMIELIGPVSEFSVDATTQVVPYDFTDTASVTLRFGTGATGTLTAIGAAPNFNRLLFYGEKDPRHEPFGILAAGRRAGGRGVRAGRHAARATGDVRRRGAGKGRLAGPAGGRAQRREGAGRDAGFVPRRWGEEGCLEQRGAD